MSDQNPEVDPGNGAPSSGDRGAGATKAIKLAVTGAAASGSSAVCRRLAAGTFTDEEEATAAVRTERTVLDVDGIPVQLTLWDLPEEVGRFDLRFLLRDTAGVVLVVDGTDPRTLDRAVELQSDFERFVPDAETLILLNKSDQKEEWQISSEEIAVLEQRGWMVGSCSARTGEGVEESLRSFSVRLIGRVSPSSGSDVTGENPS